MDHMLGTNMQSAGDRCLFFLIDPKIGNLRGVIIVATDDLLHGGDEQHWARMEWLNQHYKLGKFSRGDGRFMGKEIKCCPGGSFLVHQRLVAQKIKVIDLDRQRK